MIAWIIGIGLVLAVIDLFTGRHLLKMKASELFSLLVVVIGVIYWLSK